MALAVDYYERKVSTDQAKFDRLSQGPSKFIISIKLLLLSKRYLDNTSKKIPITQVYSQELRA